MSNTPTDTETTRNEAEARHTIDTDLIRWVSALAALAGLALVAAPFVFEATETALWNDAVVGAAILVLAGYNYVRLSKDRLASVGAAALVVLLGLWALVSPYFIEMGSTELATSTAILGLLAAGLSAYNAYANSRADTTGRASRSV